MKTKEECYRIMGLPMESDPATVKIRYKSLALKFHPDKLGIDATEKDKSRFTDIVDAYSRITSGEFDNTPFMYNEEAMLRTLFNSFFSNFESKPATIIIHVRLDINTFIYGAEKEIHFSCQTLVDPKGRKVPNINLQKYTRKCSTCRGRGFINAFKYKCGICTSKGYIIQKGFEVIKKETTYVYNIPPCTWDADQYLAGLGHINPLDPSACGDIQIISSMNHILYTSNMTYMLYRKEFQSVILCEPYKTNKLYLPNGNEVNIKPDTTEKLNTILPNVSPTIYLTSLVNA